MATATSFRRNKMRVGAITHQHRSSWRSAAVAVVATLAASLLTSEIGQARAEPGLREVMLVGNNWEGVADIIESTGDFAKIGRINLIPDKDQRLREIYLNPIKLAYFLGIRETVGEGHDQYIDDMYTTPDGSAIVVSRPSFADVVSVDSGTGQVKWRFPVSGNRADHMAVSPDGSRIAVSASTSNTVHVLDIDNGTELGTFATGDKPHENVFTTDNKIWNMAIGEVNTGLDHPALDFTKGDRKITIADATTFKVIETIDMRERLDAFGQANLSDAVRPVAFTPDESTMYFQVSFFNGFLEYDVVTDTILRLAELPKNPKTSNERNTYVNDSRHHGMSMNPAGDKLCIAGTMDDYATVVDRATLTAGPLVPAAKPYWATVSGDGTACVISESAADQVSVIDFATGNKVTSIPVGDHPQRIRSGNLPQGWKTPTA
ncbi:YncE family protein [Nocardia fluminea]|uniref:YncE family protein n=1 Tax=Nocardia fluminea TaxID=134984 RepID=UPI00343EAE87